MKRNVFGMGMARFMASTRLEYTKEDQEIFYCLLEGIPDKSFLTAIDFLCRTEKQIYPTTNIVALITDKAAEVSSISSLEAWQEVLRVANGYTQDRNGLQGDIREAVKLGCIEYSMFDLACNSGATRRECDDARIRFIKAYEGIIRKDKELGQFLDQREARELTERREGVRGSG